MPVTKHDGTTGSLSSSGLRPATSTPAPIPRHFDAIGSSSSSIPRPAVSTRPLQSTPPIAPGNSTFSTIGPSPIRLSPTRPLYHSKIAESSIARTASSFVRFNMDLPPPDYTPEDQSTSGAPSLNSAFTTSSSRPSPLAPGMGLTNRYGSPCPPSTLTSSSSTSVSTGGASTGLLQSPPASSATSSKRRERAQLSNQAHATAPLLSSSSSSMSTQPEQVQQPR